MSDQLPTPEPTPTPEPALQPDPPAPAPAPDFDALRREIEQLKAESAAAKAAADEARRAKLSEQERFAEDRKRLDAEREQLTAQKRDAVLDRLGVLPKVRQLAPAGDPSDSATMAQIEAWARQNPEFMKPQPRPDSVPVPPKSNLAKVLAGEVRNRFAAAAFERLNREG